ncbi:hypothetical protein ACMD2_13355, partial [Ananas comosus]
MAYRLAANGSHHTQQRSCQTRPPGGTRIVLTQHGISLLWRPGPQWLNHPGGEIVAQTPRQWLKPRAV